MADAPARDGLWQRRDLLAAPAGLASGRRLGPPPPQAAEPSRRARPHRLVAGITRLGRRPGEKGGEQTGANPVDRGRPGTKRHLVVDRNGVPLAALISAANVHDSKMFERLLDAVPAVQGVWGRPRKRPAKLHADKGYDFPRCRAYLRRFGITCRIARRGIESSERLGRFRWVVERTLAWLNRFRRLTVRYERRADTHHALLRLACALICMRLVQRA